MQPGHYLQDAGKASPSAPAPAPPAVVIPRPSADPALQRFIAQLPRPVPTARSENSLTLILDRKGDAERHMRAGVLRYTCVCTIYAIVCASSDNVEAPFPFNCCFMLDIPACPFCSCHLQA